jgi:Na+/H+ antiporter NhaD/arsenite permease-like protein
LDPVIGVVFVLVYAGMFLGGLPVLKLDRAGIALIGALALVISGRVSLDAAWQAIDLTTLLILFAVMVGSSLLQVVGVLTAVTDRIARGTYSPSRLLAIVVLAAGLSSAILAENVVCLVVLPVLITVCDRSGLDPVPHLLGLVFASNIGSAATVIGNAQTILVGQALEWSFVDYLILAAPPALLGLPVVWVVIWWVYQGRWTAASDEPRSSRSLDLNVEPNQPAWLRFSSLIDWRLLVLLAGLFVVNHAVAQAGLVSYYLMMTRLRGADLSSPPLLFAATAVLSNLVTAVPAVMLLLPAARLEIAGPALALSSTFATNLSIAGSMSSVMVADHAKRSGYALKATAYFWAALPVTAATLALAAFWLWAVAG